MILTDEELKAIQQTVEAQAGLDEELAKRCADLIHMGAFDEAVRSAFVLMEERLRDLVNKDGLTGTQLANFAFGQDGPLTKRLGHSPNEREGLRELFSGSFKLFRNPTAHGVVGYSKVEGKAIIELVNLMLGILAEAGEPQAEDILPLNVRKTLAEVVVTYGPSIATRLETYLVRCVKAGLKPQAASKNWIPFRIYALIKQDHWPKPKTSLVTIFYLIGQGAQGLWFPVNQYHSKIIGFDTESLKRELRRIGFQPSGQSQDYGIDLHLCNDPAFFKELLEIVIHSAKEIEIKAQKH